MTEITINSSKVETSASFDNFLNGRYPRPIHGKVLIIGAVDVTFLFNLW